MEVHVWQDMFGDGHFSLNTPSGTVLVENDGRYDLTGFRPGIYWVKVTTADGIAIGKFVVR